MTPTGWTLMAGFGALALALIVHALRYAYTQGQTDNRLNAVERAVDAVGSTHAVLAALQATVAGLKDTVDRLDRAVERMDGKLSRTRKPPDIEG